MADKPKLEYTIIDGNHESITAKVNEAIAEGWEPQGGITYRPGGLYINFTQAMVRRQKQPK